MSLASHRCRHCPSCLWHVATPICWGYWGRKDSLLEGFAAAQWRVNRLWRRFIRASLQPARCRRARVHPWKEINPPLMPSPQPIPQPATVVRWSWPCTCPRVLRISAVATAQSAVDAMQLLPRSPLPICRSSGDMKSCGPTPSIPTRRNISSVPCVVFTPTTSGALNPVSMALILRAWRG